MNRKMIVGIVAGTVLAVSITVLAAPSLDQTKKLDAVRAKMVEAQKEMVNTQAEVGLITKEEAKQIIDQLDAKVAKSTPLTEAQQKELADAYAKQVAVQKEMVNAQVEAGLITKEQGDNMLKQIDARAAYQKEIGFENFRGGMGKGGRGGRGMSRGGIRGGCDGSMMNGTGNAAGAGYRGGMMGGAGNGMMGWTR